MESLMKNAKAVPGIDVTRPLSKSSWMPVGVCFLLLSLLLRSQSAAAQAGQQFVGHVEDPSHASIAGAKVTIHNEATGEDVIVKTTRAGDYTVPYLKPGTTPLLR
jgi:hypothetical protein